MDKEIPEWVKNQQESSVGSPTPHRSRSTTTQDVLERPQNGQYNLVNLSKLYTDEQKYSGNIDSFDFKYSIFLDLCERTEILREVYLKAFPTMLKGAALNYYYTSCKSNPYITSLQDLCANIKQYFEGAEHERNTLMKWNDLTLKKTLEKNPGKSIKDSLQLLVQELRALQLGLEKDLCYKKFFFNKLLTACQDHPACSIACSKPASTTSGLISDLQSSIITYKKI